MALGMAGGIVRLGGTGARVSVAGAAAQRGVRAGAIGGEVGGGIGEGTGKRTGQEKAGGSGATRTPAQRGRTAAGLPRADGDAAVVDACAPGMTGGEAARRDEGAPRARRIAGGAERPRQKRAASASAGMNGAAGGAGGALAQGNEAGAALDGAVLNGATPDGAAQDGAAQDGAAPDGAMGRHEARRGTERLAGHTTRQRQLRFAKVLAETGNVAMAAAAAGRTEATVHRWRSVDAPFAAAWAEALAIGYDRLENALLVYALGRVDGGAAGASISNGDLQLAVGMLQRHRAATGDRRGQALPVKMPTEAESDAALKRALDGLARRGRAS